MLHTLDCPHCHHAINLEESFTRQIEQRVQESFKARQRTQLETLRQQEVALQRREAALSVATEQQQAQVDALVKAQLTTMRQQLVATVQHEQATHVATLQQELNEKSARVQELSRREGELLRQQRTLDEQQAALNGQVEKRVQAELKQIQAAALEKAREESQFDLDQQHGLINALRDQLAAMKQKLEQGSQQAQGELMEVALEQLLTDAFPVDSITEVGKGQSGADSIQEVRNEFGQVCGRIVYESKRTKGFSPAWIDKLKTDLQTHKGDIAVLVTETMPKDMPRFGLYQGVYLCTFGEARALAGILREGILRVSEVQTAGKNKGGKMQSLYDYLTGNEFRQCIESMLRSFVALKASLDREKRAMKKLWAEREKQLDLVMDSTSCLIGNVKGIAGGAIADLPDLELLTDDEPLLIA
jgi:hypothetical protein